MARPSTRSSLLAPILGLGAAIALGGLTPTFLFVATAHAAEAAADEGNARESKSALEASPPEWEEPAIKELVVESDLPIRKITLGQALALAVKHNLDVEVARYEPQIAEQDMEGSWGAYDPNFQASVGYDLAESPNTFLTVANTVSNSQQRQISGGAGIFGLLPYVGATLGIELETGRTQTNSTIAALTPQYDSSVFLTANIPVLRGLIWNEPWTQVKITKIGHASSLDGYRQAVMDIAESTIGSYWSVVADREQLGVAEKSLETALALLDQTKTQYEVGVVSKVDVVEAEAGVADREFNLIVTRNTFENSEDLFVDAILGRELRPTMNFRVQPADDPEDYELRQVDVERAIATAFANLPELRRADFEIDQREVELKFAKNQRLPQFDIDARYGYVNASGDDNVRDAGVSIFDGNYGDSFDDMYSSDGFENYSVRGTFSIPLPNRTARRNVTKGEIQLRRAKSRRVRTQQDVIVDVRSAARGITASGRGIEAAERRRLAAEEQLRAERIRLEHGESTPFEVLQRESDLVDAESQKIAALRSYRLAEARLERAQGTILDTYQMLIDAAPDAEPIMR